MKMNKWLLTVFLKLDCHTNNKQKLFYSDLTIICVIVFEFGIFPSVRHTAFLLFINIKAGTERTLYSSQTCLPTIELTSTLKTLQELERSFSSLLTAGLARVQAIHLSEYIYITKGLLAVKIELNASIVSILLDFVDVKISNVAIIIIDIRTLAIDHL